MKTLKATLPILAFFSAVLTAYSEEPKQTNEIESSVNQFLEKENKALREIIANAVKRKSFLVYENGKVTRIKIDEPTAVKLNSYLKLDSPLDDRVISLNSDLREAQIKNKDYDLKIAALNNQMALKDRAIEDISRRLETSEEDREFLLKDRDRLIADKAELEKQFKDIVAIRKKVQQLQVELMASRKLEWLWSDPVLCTNCHERFGFGFSLPLFGVGRGVAPTGTEQWAAYTPGLFPPNDECGRFSL